MDLDGDDDLKDFGNVCRLFPLPKVVLFPHAILPLHIFEKRYRQMTEDALSSDKLVTIVQWRAPFPKRPDAEPDLEEIACLGQIVQYDRLPGGKFNFLLLGRKRVRLRCEIHSEKLYRLAKAELLEDENTELAHDRPVAEITALFRQIFDRHASLDPDLANLLEAGLPLGTLTDLVAHALDLPPKIKQRLLAETRVDLRGEFVIKLLRLAAASNPSRDQELRVFPPPFSAN
jgi:Lon protease-like protein